MQMPRMKPNTLNGGTAEDGHGSLVGGGPQELPAQIKTGGVRTECDFGSGSPLQVTETGRCDRGCSEARRRGHRRSHGDRCGGET
jgi:hypothetical protein